MRRKRDTFWREAGATGGHAAALVAALALAASPVLAQQQNGCQAALQQLNQTRATIITNTQNAQNTMATDQRNAMRDCYNLQQPNDPNSGKAVDACLQRVVQVYKPYATQILDNQDTALTQVDNAARSLATGPACHWTPEEITQFITAAGQALSQMTSSAAQLITAAKSKATGATNANAGGASSGAGTKPPATSGTSASGSAAPKSPTPPKPPAPPTPPGSGSSGSSGTTPPAAGTGSPTQ